MDALPNYDFLSAFTAALELTGMADDLRATRLPLTIFAPTNKGFANFADAMDVEPKTLLENSELLYVLLQLHISPEVLDFSALETQAEIPTFDFGTTIKFSKTDSSGDLDSDNASVSIGSVTARILGLDLNRNVCPLVKLVAIDAVLAPSDLMTGNFASADESEPAPEGILARLLSGLAVPETPASERAAATGPFTGFFGGGAASEGSAGMPEFLSFPGAGGFGFPGSAESTAAGSASGTPPRIAFPGAAAAGGAGGVDSFGGAATLPGAEVPVSGPFGGTGGFAGRGGGFRPSFAAPGTAAGTGSGSAFPGFPGFGGLPATSGASTGGATGGSGFFPGFFPAFGGGASGAAASGAAPVAAGAGAGAALATGGLGAASAALPVALP
eukprot:jgi/Tetstr1/421733/TSEL_001192.t1